MLLIDVNVGNTHNTTLTDPYYTICFLTSGIGLKSIYKLILLYYWS